MFIGDALQGECEAGTGVGWDVVLDIGFPLSGE